MNIQKKLTIKLSGKNIYLLVTYHCIIVFEKVVYALKILKQIVVSSVLTPQ